MRRDRNLRLYAFVLTLWVLTSACEPVPQRDGVPLCCAAFQPKDSIAGLDVKVSYSDCRRWEPCPPLVHTNPVHNVGEDR